MNDKSILDEIDRLFLLDEVKIRAFTTIFHRHAQFLHHPVIIKEDKSLSEGSLVPT